MEPTPWPRRIGRALLGAAALAAVLCASPGPRLAAPPAAGQAPPTETAAGEPTSPAPAPASPAEPLPAPLDGPEEVASYRLTAELDPETHRIRGEGTIRWRNPTDHPAEELFFHLYLNAFRNTGSLWLWEAGGGDEEEALAEDGWGWMEIDALADAADGRDLLRDLEIVPVPSPAPGVILDDRTVARLPLERPVAPGEVRGLTIRFTSQLPRVVARTGFAGDFHLAAQWFPKLGVFEEDGTWDCPPFHYSGEFYADFGDYEITLIAPSDYVVGATGRRISRQERPEGRTAHLFVQPGVHDFAWTAWPDFVEERRSFRHPELPDVEVTLLVRPENRGKLERYYRAVEVGLEGFGRRFGPYPYPTLTVVDPPWNGWAAGGMEYPTFITTGSRLVSPLLTHSPEEVTVHEFGHQYFYGMLATDEYRESYLDEGMTTWATGRVLADAYPPQHWTVSLWGMRLPVPGVPLDEPVDTRASYFDRAYDDPIARTSWGYVSDGTYGALTYSKMALVMEQLARTVGEEEMERAMGAYVRHYRWRHPTTEDFIRVMERETGRDLTPLFDQLLYGSEILDYAVAEARTGRAQGIIGVTGTGEEREVVEQADWVPGYDSEVLVRRLGGVRLPVAVDLTFEGGRKVRRKWDGEDRWVRYRIRGPKLLHAEVDPDHVMVLDIDRLNNSRRVSADRRASRRWGQRVRFWMQNFLETVLTLG